eukprot:COSAG04_NODE_1105_length_8235_cov_48.668142_9_plen_105_part_00
MGSFCAAKARKKEGGGGCLTTSSTHLQAFTIATRSLMFITGGPFCSAMLASVWTPAHEDQSTRTFFTGWLMSMFSPEKKSCAPATSTTGTPMPENIALACRSAL